MTTMMVAMMIMVTPVSGRKQTDKAESERVRDNGAVGEKKLSKGKGRQEKVKKEKKVKGEGGRKVKWDYVVLRKKPRGGEAARWDYTIEVEGKRKSKAGGKVESGKKMSKDETEKVDKVWDYSMEINSKE